MTIHIGPKGLSFADFRSALKGPVQLSISAEAKAAVTKSHAGILRMLKSGDAIYGVNTGFGKLASARIAEGDLAQLQVNLVRSHAAGIGEPLKDATVRLILLLKLQSLALGHSGLSPETFATLAGLLEKDVLPVIPGQGSVGACGDLAPLAHMGLVLIGEGEAHYQGERMPGAQALKLAGLKPATLGPKEGLALLNGTQVSTAIALHALIETEAVMQAAILAGAMSTDAIKGSDTPFDPRIHALRPHRGQVELAALYRKLLEGSAIRASHLEGDTKVQDPYSFRCQPQVMGACLDAMRHAQTTLTIEANAVSDNPLVFADDDAVLSGGNFHAEPVAFAADHLALAIAEIGAISERRIAELTDTSISELPAFLVRESGLNSGYMIAHVTAAALASENKMLSHPASVDSLPTSANQEDHVSMATHGALRLHRMIANTRAIIAIELMAGAEGIDFRRPLKSSAAIEVAHETLRAKIAPRTVDRVFGPEIELVSSLVQQGVFSAFTGDLL
ncbi:MAG: histidine ammonia-lyase [Aestuariivirgaceae bacterium]|nr:histidine ammonia-lyase [Aestuariivirgaceae bacterium]